MGSQAEQSSFLFAHNAAFIGDLYDRYRSDPTSVDQSWQDFFGSLGHDAKSALGELTGSETKGPSWGAGRNGSADAGSDAPAFADAFQLTEPPPLPARNSGKSGPAKPEASGVSQDELVKATMDSIRALMLVRAYRVRGHLEAKLDPLGLESRDDHPELDPKTYGFTEADMDRPIYLNMVLGFERASLRQIIERLRATYCGHIGVEYLHIQDPDQKAWIQERIEVAENKTDFTVRGRRAILERLTATEVFEKFLHLKYTGTKRFGLDGGEALVPAIEQVMKRGGHLGLREIVIGMSHRGRLNVLANVMGKPFAAIFSEFQGNPANPEDVQGSGDVKYHLGTSSDRDFDGHTIHLSLTANPSHLEAVNPVVVGKVRAKQAQQKDTEREKVMGLLIHGDAAFAGQGVVPETLMLSELKGYRIGGTVHFIVNNQIGFTTSPQFGRSSPYPTDVAKGIQAPILHVNGDDPEAVVHASRIAIEFRQAFKKDVVVDIFCYRRFGHNEGDEPAFTQPLMYKTIGGHQTTRQIYADRLEAEGVIEKGEGDRIVEDFSKHLENEYEASSSYKPNKADWLGGAWEGLSIATGEERRGKTAVSKKTLQEVGRAITTVPEGFNANSKITRQLKVKAKAIEEGKGIDWPLAEALAFGTLCREGFPVRLSGQDSGRGTFSQRHSVLIDQETEERYVPLNTVSDDQAGFEVHDSPLSEFAVMGFDYGFSLAEPNALTLWEGQFGDFCNGAQIIIDQFLSCGEQKWLRMSGLVLLLPHGYEGQGPEHSSARLERFLAMSAEDNWQVIYPTTPANYFHALRRQLHRDFRKPLIVMTPKSILRQKYFVSDIGDFVGDSTFHRVLFENGREKPDDSVRRVIICTGKVYYDLLQERDARGLKDITLLRVEQIYPFPERALTDELSKYPNADVVWCQEEPENMGAWHFVDRRIEAILEKIGHKARRPKYAGRKEAASPATGVIRRHQREQAAFVEQALTID